MTSVNSNPYPCKAATAPKQHFFPTITAASHSRTPLELGNPPFPTKQQPVSGSSSITRNKLHNETSKIIKFDIKICSQVFLQAEWLALNSSFHSMK